MVPEGVTSELVPAAVEAEPWPRASVESEEDEMEVAGIVSSRGEARRTEGISGMTCCEKEDELFGSAFVS